MGDRRDPAEIRASAIAYLAAVDAFDAAPEDPLDGDLDKDGPLMLALLEANARFTDAIGFGFDADSDEVARLLVEVIPAAELTMTTVGMCPHCDHLVAVTGPSSHPATVTKEGG